MQLNYTYITTPLGGLLACATDHGVCLLEFYDDEARAQLALKKLSEILRLTAKAQEHPHFIPLRTQLALYFNRTLTEFSVPLHMVGTVFQKSVWNVLLTIPYGRTRSYKDQAIALGNIKAIRAVAGANGQNKISIIIPCHRVIGTDGSLTGYAGGLERKQYLLTLESEQAFLL